MFNGYLSFAGNELANAERTATYIRHAIPSFGLQEAYAGCEYLAEALGDQPYSSPMSDTAPWFSPFNESSADFYGLIPLAIDGIEDGTREAAVTETTFDGAVVSRARNASRQIRVRALAAAADERAMETGMAWLRDALAGSDCSEGNCEGDDLCWLVDCPEPCDYSGAPDLIVDTDIRRAVAADNRIRQGDGIAYLESQGWSFPKTIARGTYMNSGSYVSVYNTDGSQSTMSYLMSDLVPGGTYRVNIGYTSLGSNTDFRISVPGTAGSYDATRTVTPYDIAANNYVEWSPPNGVAVYEFVATSGVHRLLLEGLPIDDQFSGYSDILFVGALVERVPYPSIILADYTNERRPESILPWTRSAVVGSTRLSGYWSVDHLKFGLYSRSAAGSDVVPAGALWAKRSVSGLTPGKRYRLLMFTGWDARGADQTTQAPKPLPGGSSVGVQVGINGIGFNDFDPDNFQAWSSQNPNVQWGWASYEFQAAAASHEVMMRNASAVTLYSQSGGYSSSSLDLLIAYLRVEEIVDGVAPENPDYVSPLRRTLRNVTCIAGPTKVRDYDKRSGTIREIEFILQAGDPRPVGEEMDVPALLGPGVVYVPEQECSLGEPVRKNWLKNPSFETGIAGYTVTYASQMAPYFTLSNPVSPQAVAGTRALRWTCTTTVPVGSEYAGMKLNTLGGFDVVYDGLVGGMFYTLSFSSYTPTIGTSSWAGSGDIYSSAPYGYISNANGYATLADVGYNPVGPVLVKGSQAFNIDIEPIPTLPPQRQSFTFFLPAGATVMKFSVALRAPVRDLNNPGEQAQWRAGDYIEFDGFLLEQGQQTGPYFDGSTNGGAWDGTAHASTSTWIKTGTPLVVDPDCTPIPSPPRAPIVLTDCVDPADLWVRYVTEIPTTVLQQSPASLPVVRIGTGSVPLRGVRVRFQANPMNEDWAQLNPCSYCGEFLVSYIPPGAVLTVDTSLRSATLTMGGEDQTAMHLLYGSDGGPVVWPELKCGTPYLMFTDVDSTTNPLTSLDLSVIPAY